MNLTSEIQNSKWRAQYGSHLPGQTRHSQKIVAIDFKVSIRGFSWSLNTNLISRFQNLKWLIQYGDRITDVHD